MTTAHKKPAPASAFVKATKADRQKFLDEWALEHPTATIEEGRAALRARFDGIAMGTKAISDTLRLAKDLWEEQRQKAQQTGSALQVPVLRAVPTPEPATSAQAQVAILARAMEAAGVQLLERRADGSLRVEFAPLSAGGSHVGDDHGPDMDNTGLHQA